MKSKYKVTEVDRDNRSPIVQIKVNEPIKEAIFYLNGMPYIVGASMRFVGGFCEMELMPIQEVKEMHIHNYWNGICHLCGIYKIRSQEVMDFGVNKEG